MVRILPHPPKSFGRQNPLRNGKKRIGIIPFQKIQRLLFSNTAEIIVDPFLQIGMGSDQKARVHVFVLHGENNAADVGQHNRSEAHQTRLDGGIHNA